MNVAITYRRMAFRTGFYTRKLIKRYSAMLLSSGAVFVTRFLVLMIDALSKQEHACSNQKAYQQTPFMLIN